MAGALTGFGKLTLVTTDGSGPNGQEGGYFPYITAVNLSRTSEKTEKFAYKPCGGGGVRQKVASYITQVNWEGSFTMPVASWLDLELLWGQKSQTVSQTVPDVNCATVASNIITDASLNGVAATDITVTWIDYDATGGAPVQLEVDVSPAVASATKVILDNTANTLTFAAQFEGLEIYYTINTTSSKRVLGRSGSTAISTLSFYGVVNTSGSSSAAGYGIYIPELTLDLNVNLSVTGDDELEVPFSPVLIDGYSDPVALIEL